MWRLEPKDIPEEIKEKIEWIDKDHGIVRVKPKIKEAEILEYSVREVSPPVRVKVSTPLAIGGAGAIGLGYKALQERRRLLGIGLVCAGGLLLLASAGGEEPEKPEQEPSEEPQYKICKKYRKPKILFRLAPAWFENVKFHWGGLWFEGEIVNKFDNQSQEGEEGTVKVPKDEPCPENEAVYEWRPLKGTADLLGSWLHKFWEDENNIFIAQLTQKLKEKVKPFKIVELKGYWKTEAFSLETFQTLFSIFTSGTIVTRNGFDVKLVYEFRGQLYEQTYHVDTRVRLPVKGDVEWWNW